MFRKDIHKLCNKSVSSKILEPGQIADWIIEQMDHSFLNKLPGRCEAASYDMSGNCWRYFSKFTEKLVSKPSTLLVKLLENEKEYVHLDSLDLNDFDALIVSKLIKHRNTCTKLLDLNNNPQIGDIGFEYVCKHVLKGDKIRSLFVSGCGITDDGVSLIPMNIPMNFQILELRKNSISNEGAELLAKKLTKTKGEFTLFLNDNPQIGESGAVALAKAVIESEGRLKVWLKNSCVEMSTADKEEISKFTHNRIRF